SSLFRRSPPPAPAPARPALVDRPPHESGPGAFEPPLQGPKPTDARQPSSKPDPATQKTPDLLGVGEEGMSDEMALDVTDAAKTKSGNLVIGVRIGNRSETLIKHPYCYFTVYDQCGNLYGVAPGNGSASLYPGNSLEERHPFDRPVEKAEYVIL